MTILIDNKSGQPIYEQIVDQIREQILTGALGADEALPSIRSLAKDLRISVITTKRAYEELEQEGFLYTVAGKGCFVAEKNTELLREEDPGSVVELLLEQQETALRKEIDTQTEKLEKLEALRRELKSAGEISVESIGDIACTMTNNNKLKKVRRTLVLTAIPVGILEIAGILLWVLKGV